MLSREKQDKMRAAIQHATELQVETDHGHCTAVDDETGDEWSYKWRGGEARVFHDDEEAGEYVEYVFAVRVELVAVTVGPLVNS